MESRYYEGSVIGETGEIADRKDLLWGRSMELLVKWQFYVTAPDFSG